MIPQPVTLKDFLETSNLAIADNLPWVHSASSGDIWDFINAGKILALPCSVFRPEKLCYFFVGRPAYKRDDILNPGDWELPMAFVMKFKTPPKIKRVFPFDSGAFATHRFPSYITAFSLERFDISGDDRNIGRLISLIYRNREHYVYRRPAGYEDVKQEHDLLPRHREILAVSKLATENAAAKMDDRAAAIEISVIEDVPITADNLIGIVVPEELKRERELWLHLNSISKHIETYSHLPASLHGYYSRMSECVNRIYRRNGIKL